MSERAKSLMRAVMELPEDERLEFASSLMDLFAKPPGIFSEDDAEFEAELDRRIDDYEAGRVRPIPGKEFFQRLREKAK